MLVCCDKTLLSPFHSEVSIPGGMLLETEMLSPLDQLRQRWENLNKDQSTKLQLSLNTLEQDQLSPVQVHLFFSKCNKLCNLTFAVSQSLCLSLLLSRTITHICPSYVPFVCRSSTGPVCPVPVWSLEASLAARTLTLPGLCLRPAARLWKESPKR